MRPILDSQETKGACLIIDRPYGLPCKVKRFWSKVKKTRKCWLWMAALDGHGYGKIMIGSRKDNSRKYRSAHRVSYELTKGKIGKDLCVLHKCDVRHCVNPNHLWLGTKRDNTQDMIRKGRSRMKQHQNP